MLRVLGTAQLGRCRKSCPPARAVCEFYRVLWDQHFAMTFVLHYDLIIHQGVRNKM